jgi:SAM-dependent methyltransferase
VFKNAEDSHKHSLGVLEMLYQYDSFLDSLEVIADMGCGSGLDAQWWAQLMNRESPPKPHDYLVYAVDKDTSKIDPKIVSENKNMRVMKGDFTDMHFPSKIDLMWAHDSFQYALNPLHTLNHWNNSMNINGMLVLTLPQHTSYAYNRLQTRSHSGCYFHYNICNLMYMLAVNGFDCRDCYVYSEPNYDWMHIAVYKSYSPMDPGSTTWFDLADKGLVNDSVVQSLNNYGYVKQEELIFTWLDKNWRFVRN